MHNYIQNVYYLKHGQLSIEIYNFRTTSVINIQAIRVLSDIVGEYLSHREVTELELHSLANHMRVILPSILLGVKFYIFSWL